MKDDRRDEIMNRFIEMLSKDKRSYNSVLTGDEKRLIDPDSFGYLLKLFQIGTIDGDKMERIIDACLYIGKMENKPIELERVKRLANILIHYDSPIAMSKDLIFLINEFDDEESLDGETIH